MCLPGVGSFTSAAPDRGQAPPCEGNLSRPDQRPEPKVLVVVTRAPTRTKLAKHVVDVAVGAAVDGEPTTDSAGVGQASRSLTAAERKTRSKRAAEAPNQVSSAGSLTWVATRAALRFAMSN